MKKQIKIISLILAAVMSAAALPLTGSAKTLLTSADNLNELDLKLELKHLADYKTDATDGNITYVAQLNQNSSCKVSGDKIVNANTEDSTADGLGWMNFVGKTNLELNENSQYVIAFTAESKYDTSTNPFGFIFAGTTNKNSQHAMYAVTSTGTQPKFILGDGYSWSTSGGNRYATATATAGSFNGKHNYVLTIDKMTVTLYQDGTRVISGTVSEYNATVLSIGWRANYKTVIKAGEEVVAMTDIKVYEGVYEQRTVNNYKDGDVLLKMATAFSTDFTSDFEDLTVTAQGQGFQNGKTGEDAQTLYRKSLGKGDWLFAGVNTNLPLNETTKYTVDFYLKRHAPAKVGFCWGVGAWNNSQGIYCYEDSIGTVKGYTTGAYGSVGSCAGLWTDYQDNDGYTRFTLQIDGYSATVYVGGVRIGTMSVGDDGYVASTLGLAFKGQYAEYHHGEAGSPIVSIKDITVYAGNVAPDSKVEFVNDGRVISTEYAAIGSTLAADKFPMVEPKTAGNAVRWFYKGTDYMVLAPYEVDGDAVLEAKELDASYTSVAGVQYTASEDDKQSIRVVARLYSLRASEVGIEVRARYTDVDDTVKEDMSWAVKSTVVYTSIKATKDDAVTTVTAEELGASYLIALAFDDVPTSIGQLDMFARSYAIVNGEKQYSEWASWSMNDGTHVSDAKTEFLKLENDFSTPVLRFVVASDIHLKDEGDVYDEQFRELFASAYAYSDASADYNALDAIMIAGDCTDNGTQEQINRFFSIANANLREGTTFGAVLGNHEFNTVSTVAGVKEMFTSASGLDDVNHHWVINGYHFILVSVGRDGEKGWYYSTETYEWLEKELAKAAADDPTGKKPIFCIEHIPPSNTVSSITMAPRDGLDFIYKQYPQIVSFSGHTHAHINSAVSMDQHYYTSLNTGGFKGMGVNYYSGYDETVNADNATVTGRGGGYYIIEVDANNIVKIQAYDIYDEDFYYESRYVQVGNRRLFTYTDNRKVNGSAPEFSENANISMNYVDAETLTVTFDQASGDYMTIYYKVELYVDGALSQTKLVRSGLQWICATDELTTTFDTVAAGTEYCIKVTAVDEWKKESLPISIEFAPFAE